MKRVANLISRLIVSVSFLFLIGNFQEAGARLTGTNPTGANADTWCEGPRGAEVCVDYQGDVLSTTNNDATLGTSSLRWSDVETIGLNTGGGSLSIPSSAGVATSLGTAGTANTAGSGNGAAPSLITITGALNFGVQVEGTNSTATTGIYTSTTIPIMSNYMTLLSSSSKVGENFLMLATPTIATTTVAGGATAIADGTILILTSTSTAIITLQDNGTLSGSLLELGAATRAISQFKVLTLVFQGRLGKWLEIAYANN